MNVLFICTANRDRSPTAEAVFKSVPGWRVRSAGTESYAETQMTEEMLEWADKIFVMEGRHRNSVLEICSSCSEKTTVLDIEDVYTRNSAKLVAKLITKMAKVVDLDEWAAMKFDLKLIEENLQRETAPKGKYYTEENPGGPWGRALHQMRTGKSIKEEELKHDKTSRSN